MVLVTGGNGFLGSHLLVELLHQGEDIRVLRRHDSSWEILKRVFISKGLDPDQAFKRIEWVEGDILDIFSLEEAMEQIDEVYHCAAVVSFDKAKRGKMIRVNVEGTANVVNMALKHQVRKLCYVSSIAALGRGDTEAVITEKSHWKTSPQNSNYAVSKYGGEREVWRAVEEGLNVIIVNPAIILGFGEAHSGTARFFEAVRKGLMIYPAGSNGFVYVDDVVSAMFRLMKSGTQNERFLLSAENLPFKTLFELIAGNLDKRPPRIRAGRLLTAMAWRFEGIRSRLMNNKPLITKESALTALNKYAYNGEKIVDRFDFKYTPVVDCLKIIAGMFKKYWNNELK
jgi:dihydroflavonol-4-reductase